MEPTDGTQGDTTTASALTAGVQNVDATNFTDITGIGPGDYLMIGESGNREICVVSTAPMTVTITVDHAAGEVAREFGLVTDGYLSEAPGSSSPDNIGQNNDGHYTWWVTNTGSVQSCYNSTAEASDGSNDRTDIAAQGWSDDRDVYP